MSKVIAVANQKGGVGKTTTAMNIGAGLVKAGKRVLLIDLDPQGNLSDYLGHTEDGQPTIGELMTAVANNQHPDIEVSIRKSPEGMDYIPSNIMLSGADLFLATVMCREQVLQKLLRQDVFEAYEFILIDCLPSLGILLTNALAASDSVIIPVQAQKFARDGLQQLIGVYGMVKANINPRLTVSGVLVTMADNTNMSKAVEAALATEFPNEIFQTKIHKSVEATNSTYAHQSLIATAKSRLGEEYELVVAELLERCEE